MFVSLDVVMKKDISYFEFLLWLNLIVLILMTLSVLDLHLQGYISNSKSFWIYMAILVIIERDPAPGIVSNKHILFPECIYSTKPMKKTKHESEIPVGV